MPQNGHIFRVPSESSTGLCVPNTENFKEQKCFSFAIKTEMKFIKKLSRDLGQEKPRQKVLLQIPEH